MIKNDIALAIEKKTEFSRAKSLLIVEAILESLKEDLAKAEQAVTALVPEQEQRAFVAVSIDAAAITLSPHLKSLLTGSLVVGLIAAVVCYYPTRRAVRRFQRRRRALALAMA